MSNSFYLEISNFILSFTVITHASFIINIITSGLNKTRTRLVILLTALTYYPASTFLFINSDSFIFERAIGLAGVIIAMSAVYFLHNFPHKQPKELTWIKLFYWSGLPLMILAFYPGFWPSSYIEGDLFVSSVHPAAYLLGFYILSAIVFIIINTYKSQLKKYRQTKLRLFTYFITFAFIASTLDIFYPIIHPTTSILTTALASASSIIFSLGLYKIFKQSENTFSPHSFTQLLTTFLVLLIIYSYAISYNTSIFIRLIIIAVAAKVGYDTLHQIKLEHTEHAELEQKHVANMEFISDIAHRLKTPLIIMKLKLDQALTEHPDTAVATTLQEIDQIADTTTKTMHHFVQSGKIDAQLMTIRPRRLNLSELLLSWEGEIRSLLNQHHLILQIKKGCFVQADPDLLKEAVFNLLDNARKFSPAGSRIKVSLGQTAKSVKLAVSDQGVGIKKNEIDHIFDRHWQGRHQKKQVGSAGLGLSLVKWVVQQHRGEIIVTSTPKHSTTFTIKLPVGIAKRHPSKIEKIFS